MSDESVFRVLIRGTNYVTSVDDVPARLEFRVHRYVQADSADAAMRRAIELVRADRRMDGQTAVRLEVEEVALSNEDPAVGNRSGFRFYDASHDA